NSRGIPFFSWQLNCAILGAASVTVLLISTVLVRRIALRQATGQLVFAKRRKRNRLEKYGVPAQEPYVKIRSVKDPPVIWKELRMPMLGRHKILAGITIFLVSSLLIFIYWLCARERALDDPDVHTMFVAVFLLLGIMFTVILTSTGITTEKEARSWPILLTTTLDDRQILFGKYIGTLRRLLPAWILLFAHVVVFSLDGIINPVAVVQITILVAWIVTFLFCTGVYFSSRFKHTTTAVIVNLIFAAAVWLFIPILLFLLDQFVHIRELDNYAETYMDTNPFLHAVVIINANTHASGTSYDWASFQNATAFKSTIWMLTCLAGYTFVGLLFAWRAKCRFRKNIF
ncbi:MAG: ABC transporter permease, partial [Sedimentisphaerales bacterium]